MLSLSPPQQNKIPLLTLLTIHVIFAIGMVFTYLHCDLELQKEARSQEITAAATILSKLFYDTGLAIGAYSLTRNEMFADRYQKLIGQIPQALQCLRTLAEQQPVKEIKFEDIDQAALQVLGQLKNAKATIDIAASSPLTDDHSEIRSLYKRVKLVTDQLQNKLDQLSQGEQKLSQDSPKHRMIFQFLLTVSFAFYVSFNVTIQQKLSNLVCRLSHNSEVN